jgi:hypothetical protein
MACPICEAAAAEVETGPGNYEIVDCPACGMYEIERSVLVASRWTNLKPERRREALDKAGRIARSGERPRILTYMLPS